MNPLHISATQAAHLPNTLCMPQESRRVAEVDYSGNLLQSRRVQADRPEVGAMRGGWAGTWLMAWLAPCDLIPCENAAPCLDMTASHPFYCYFP